MLSFLSFSHSFPLWFDDRGLARAIADVHCYDLLTNKWSRITSFGEPPTPRAAHVATVVGKAVENLKIHSRYNQISFYEGANYKTILLDTESSNSTENKFGGNGDRAEEDIAEVKGTLQNEAADHGDKENLQRYDMEINGFTAG
ncbi:Serine/threonine-protein phosphatase BSL2 [Camellia lanceoleosa]|uniref:Serine/threonine-protein phosphatase BSL2 n=1 Tax=Camellia lanceoleosa TaxID=1840588 RepID=A0ACC0I1L7_9ERIC|nr:Serine/threonine-protein phosphatase BSL2 [Camellia lanceoleosa]